MQRSTILKILAVAGVGVAGYYCYRKITEQKPVQQTKQPTSIALGAVGTDYFKKLAVQNAQKYKQAQKKLDQLANDNMSLHQKLAKQFQNEFGQFQQPVMIGMPPQNFTVPTFSYGKNTMTADQVSAKIDEVDDDGDQMQSPYDGVGPGVRKLNIEDE